MLFTTIHINYREDHIPHSCGTIIKKLRMLQEEIIMTVTPKFIKRDDLVGHPVHSAIYTLHS